MENPELPLGFMMALAQNSDAFQNFALLSDSRKREIINGAHSVSSKSEMKDYVDKLTANIQ